MASKTRVTRTPAKTSNAAVDAVGRRVKKPGEPELAMYADRKITPVMDDFVAFIEAQTGYKPDPMSGQLGSALRGRFQKSDANQARMGARKQEIAAEQEAKAQRAEERAARKAERAAAPKAEKVATKAAPQAKVTTPAKARAAKVVEAANTVAKAPTAKTSAKKSAATPRVPSTLAGRRRPVAKSTSVEEF